MRVTVLSTHVGHVLSRLSSNRFADVGLRTAVHAAAAGHQVTLLVVRGTAPNLVRPGRDKHPDTPYHEAAACVERVTAEAAAFRQQYAAPEGLDGQRRDHFAHTPEEPVEDDTVMDVPDLPEHILHGGEGELRIEFIDPPPIRFTTSGQHQDWTVALMAGLPPSSDAIIDACGPDILNVSHVDADNRHEVGTRSLRVRSELDYEKLGGVEDQWKLGRAEFPSISTVVTTLVHHVQAMRVTRAFLREGTSLQKDQEDPNKFDIRKQDLHLKEVDPVKVWFLNDWRALDLSESNRTPIVKTKGFCGSRTEGGVGAAMAAGIQHQVRRVWKYSDELKNWSILCTPPALPPSEDMDLTSASLDALRVAAGWDDEALKRTIRISVNSAAVEPLPILDALTDNLTSKVVCASLLPRGRMSPDSIAGFLVSNLETRKHGIGEALNNADLQRELKRSQIGESVLNPEELRHFKAELAKEDRVANVFNTLHGHSNTRFVRRRVGVSDGAALAPRSFSAMCSGAAEVRRMTRFYADEKWPKPGHSSLPFGAAMSSEI